VRLPCRPLPSRNVKSTAVNAPKRISGNVSTNKNTQSASRAEPSRQTTETLMGKKLVRVVPSAETVRKGAVQAGISSSMIAAEQANVASKLFPALCPSCVLQREQKHDIASFYRRLNPARAHNFAFCHVGLRAMAWRIRRTSMKSQRHSEGNDVKI